MELSKYLEMKDLEKFGEAPSMHKQPVANVMAELAKHVEEIKMAEKSVKNTPLVINATQHVATEDQINAGVYTYVDVQHALTFDSLPNQEEMLNRAHYIAQAVWNCHVIQCEINCINPFQETCYAMIGGAPYFMATLESILKGYNIKPVYAFSKRESVETHNEDGSVSKSMVFKHLGFVEA